MSSKPEVSSFDPDSIIDELCGSWIFTAPDGWLGRLHFTKTGRAIQFLEDPSRPKLRHPMPLWFSVESPTQLSFRFKPGQEGWLRGYQFDGGMLTMSADDYKFVCTRPAAEEIPDWFHEALASFLTPNLQTD